MGSMKISERFTIIVLLQIFFLIFINSIYCQSWTQLFPTGGTTSARALHTAVFDTSSNQMIIFGGFNYDLGSVLNDIWVLKDANGLDGDGTWTQLTPTGSMPTTREVHTAIYDNTNHRMIIFGGQDNNGNFFNDVWVLTDATEVGTPPSWIQLAATGSSPTTRGGHTAVYDNTNNRMIIFGGSSNYGVTLLNDTWVLSNANGLGGDPTWTKLTTTGTLPTGRANHTAIFDDINNIMIVFGGVWYYRTFGRCMGT